MRQYKSPIWVDDRKISVLAMMRHKEGEPLRQIKVTQPDENGINEDWSAIMEQFTTEQIDDNTAEWRENQRKENDRRRIEHEARKESRRNVELFQIKSMIANIPEIIDCDDEFKPLRRRIRKSDNIEECRALSAYITHKMMDRA